MFISHYDKNFISCTNSQFDMLFYYTKALFILYNKRVFEHDILEALFEDDDIFYSAKYLFSSLKELEELERNYCNLAKLIYLYYDKNCNLLALDFQVQNLSLDILSSDIINFLYED